MLLDLQPIRNKMFDVSLSNICNLGHFLVSSFQADKIVSSLSILKPICTLKCASEYIWAENAVTQFWFIFDQHCLVWQFYQFFHETVQPISAAKQVTFQIWWRPSVSHRIKPAPESMNGCDWPVRTQGGGKSFWIGVLPNVSARANETWAYRCVRFPG